jgi:hypothetical protein
MCTAPVNLFFFSLFLSSSVDSSNRNIKVDREAKEEQAVAVTIDVIQPFVPFR